MKPGWTIALLGAVASAAVAVGIAFRPRAPRPAPDAAPAATDVRPETPTLDMPAYAMANLEPVEGYLTDWVVAGPVPVGAPGAMPGTAGLVWTPVGGRPDRWAVDPAGVLGARHGTAVARTRVRLPAGEDALLEMGSAGPVSAWLNGESVYVRRASRPLARLQDFVPVRLRGGVNEILLRMAGDGVDGAFCCRLRRLDGNALGGMEVEAR